MKLRRPDHLIPHPEPAPRGQHRWSVLVEYPITRHQAGLVVDGAELELNLEHPMGVVVVCHLCEQPYALVEGQRCAGIPKTGP